MRAIGIDLGTTNSAAAIAEPELTVLPTRAGESLTPSVVSFVRKRKSQGGEIIAGRQAWNNAARDPVNTIFSIKRLMGRVFGESKVDEVIRRAAFQIAEAPPADEQDQGVRVLLNGEPYSPTQISTMILSQVKADAELALGEPVTHAVITVPAYFEERQRKATEAAGEEAGLRVIKIIDEPTAAALAFGVGKEEERHRVLVFDLGGGTFDISIIQMTGGQFSTLEIQGDNWLGGDDFDQVIVNRMMARIQEEYDFDPSGQLGFLLKAKVEAEAAKKALGVQQEVEIFKPLFLNVPGLGPVDLELELSRDEFEKDIQPSVQRTIQLVHEGLDSQSLKPEHITEVLMVGGSTAVPCVHEAVAAVFGPRKVKRHVNPMECVALGAAILAASTELESDVMEAKEGAPRLEQVTPMDLGIAAVKGEDPDTFVAIIDRNTPYPLREAKSRIFYPTAQDQTLIKVPVYEGLSKKASLNEQQGVVEFPLPEGLDPSTAVEVTFNYDQNRTLTVGIRVVGTDQFIEETLRRDRPRVLQGTGQQTLMDDWREDLAPSIRAGTHFQQTYGEYMSETDRAELAEAIQDGQKALDGNLRAAGEQATLVLRNKILGSGIASQMFVAERAMHDAPPETQQIMAKAISDLRGAHARQDQTQVDELSMQLKIAVAQLVARQAAVKEVRDREGWDDLLRVRE
ncbi:MAG: Hsp70 family protein [bacterium]|nr:Hsp70 family protein [bacterium]